MRSRQPLSKAEMEIARIVWDSGGATVRQVLEALPAEREVDYKTVQTYLRRLEAKGYLKAARHGRSSLYQPAVEPGKVVRETVRDFVNRLFGGQALPLVLHLIEDKGLRREEMEQLRSLIDRLEWERESHEKP